MASQVITHSGMCDFKMFKKCNPHQTKGWSPHYSQLLIFYFEVSFAVTLIQNVSVYHFHFLPSGYSNPSKLTRGGLLLPFTLYSKKYSTKIRQLFFIIFVSIGCLIKTNKPFKQNKFSQTLQY